MMFKIPFFTGIFGTVFCASAVWAYIPPSQFLVNQITNKHKSQKKLWVSSSIIPYENGSPAGNPLTEILVVDYATKKIQSRIYGSHKAELYVVVRNLYESKGMDSTGPVVNRLLFGARADEVTSDLMTAGVPIMTESKMARLEDELQRRKAENTALRRWNKRLLWVIGKELRGEIRAQLWIEKDSFLPLRWIKRLSDDLDNDLVTQEVRLDDYRFSRGYSYPGKITILQGEEVIFEVQLNKFAVNPDKKYPLPKERGLTEAGQRESSKVRGLIEQFYSVLR